MATSLNSGPVAMVSAHGGHSGQFCSHAVDSLEDIVRRYVELGFEWVGLTEHMPAMDDTFVPSEERQAGLDARDTRAIRGAYFLDLDSCGCRHRCVVDGSLPDLARTETKTPRSASSAGVRLPRGCHVRQPRRLLPSGDDRSELGVRNGSRGLGSRVGDHKWDGFHRHRPAHDLPTPGMDDSKLRNDVRIRHVSSVRWDRDGDERRNAHRTAHRGRLVLLGRASADHGSRHPGKEAVA